MIRYGIDITEVKVYFYHNAVYNLSQGYTFMSGQILMHNRVFQNRDNVPNKKQQNLRGLLLSNSVAKQLKD